MRHTDAIQIDRAYYRAAAIIKRLRTEKGLLLDENISLKNKPETVAENNPRNFRLPVVPDKKSRIDLSIPVKKWNVHHFIRYFQMEYKKFHRTDYRIQGPGWKACGIRMKNFQNTYEDVKKNEDYKDMIDWLFAHKFTQTFPATIPLISHPEMLNQWLVAKSTAPNTDFDNVISKIPETTRTAEELLRDAF